MKEGIKRSAISKHIMLIAMGVILVTVLYFALSTQISKAYAAEGGIVANGTITTNGSNLDWQVVETATGQELQLGKAGSQQRIALRDNLPETASEYNGTTIDHTSEAVRGARATAWPWFRTDIYANITSVDVLGTVEAEGSLQYLFSGMPELEVINNLHRIDVKKVTNLNNLFSFGERVDENGTIKTYHHGCEKLTTINGLKEWGVNTGNVRWMWDSFVKLNSLEKLDLSGWDTSSLISVTGTFGMNENLKEIDLTGWNTAKLNDMGWMFNPCPNLEKIKGIENFNTGNVTNLHSCFMGCKSIKSLDLSKWDTSKVVDMAYTFNSCEALTSLNLKNWNTSNVKPTTGGNIEGCFTGMFWNCKNLTQLDVSSFDTSNANSMNYMFAHCDNLQNLDVSNFDTGNVKNMYGMFSGIGASEIDISGWDTSNVENMGWMFDGAKNLTTIKGLEGMDTSNATSMRGMFAGSEKLETTAPLTFDMGKVTDSTNMLNGCAGIIAKLDEMSKSNQYSTATKTKLKDAKDWAEALTAPGTTTEQIKEAFPAIASVLKEAAKEDAQRALDNENSQAVQEAVNNASSATKKAYDDAKTELEKVLADSNATANDINKATAALNDAIEGLTPKSDAEKAADAAKIAYEDAKKKADEEAAKNPGSDAAVKAAEEATAKAKDFQKAADDAVKAAEATGNKAEIDAAKALKEEADKALADATKLEAEQKIKRAENNPTEENKKAAQDAANKALDAAKKAYGENSAQAQAAQQLVNNANNLTTTPILKVGDKFVVNSQKYEVLSLPSNGNCEAALAKGRNAKSVSVPKTVVYGGKTFDVTEINTKAFYKKTKKVTVGANVDRIDKQAFRGSKVSTVVLKTKELTKKSIKGSLKKSKVKTVKVKVGGKKANRKYVKKYKKIFTKKNAGKKVTVK